MLDALGLEALDEQVRRLALRHDTPFPLRSQLPAGRPCPATVGNRPHRIMARKLRTLLARRSPSPSPARRPADAAKRFTIRGAGFGHGVGMSQYGAMGYAEHGWDYKRDPGALLHRHGARRAQGAARRARAAAVDARRRPRSPAPRAPAGRTLSPARRTTPRGARRRQVRAARPARARAGDRRRAAARRPGRAADAQGRAGNGRATAPTAARSSSARGRSAASTRSTRVALDDYVQGRDPARVARLVADRGAQGAGRRRAHLRAHDLQGRRRLRALPGHALAGLRRRRRRAALDEPGRRRRPPGQLVTYQGPPVPTYFFSTSGGRTEDVENTTLGNEPQPWLKSVEDQYDERLAEAPLGPDPDELRDAPARKLRGLVKGRFRGIKVVAARLLAARRRRRRHRLGRAARASTGRRCARASASTTRGRTSRRSRRAQPRRRPTPDPETGGARRRSSSRVPTIGGLAGRVLPARTGAPRAGPASHRRALGHGRLDSAAAQRPLPRRRAEPASTASSTRATPGPGVRVR